MKKIKFNTIYFYIFILFALTLPLSRATISLFGALIFILWFIEGNFKSKFKKILSNKLNIIIITLVFYSYISLLWSSNISFNSIKNIDYMFLLLIPIAYSIFRNEWTSSIITSFLIGMFISEICSYGIFFEIWSTKHGTPLDPTPFMNHIEYSIFLAFASILLLSRLFSNYYTNKEKYFILPFFLTVTINLFITGGRTGQVALIVSIIVMFILHYKITIKSILLSIITLLLIYITAYNTSDQFKQRVLLLNENLNYAFNKQNFRSSAGIRLSYYILVYDILKDDYKSLIFGVGITDAQQSIINILDKNLDTKYKNMKFDTKFLQKHSTHMQFLQILLELGLVGLSLILLIYYLLIKASYYTCEVKNISILFVTIFGISSLFDIILELQFPRTLFILFVTLAIVNIKTKQKKCDFNKC